MANGTRPSREDDLTLERRLFNALHDRLINSPSIKEFNEAWSFLKVVRKFFSRSHNNAPFDVVIDVAGGHGALAALFLITSTAQSAVVIDPARVGSNGVHRAWGDVFFNTDQLRFRHECLRNGLPAELAALLPSHNNNHVVVAAAAADSTTTRPDRILVVACHACQHLSEETVEIACRFGVQCAVMPCCQKDPSPGSSWKATSRGLGIPVEPVMDILLAGKAMSWGVGAQAGVRYDVRMKMIDASITPQNRVILCRAVVHGDVVSSSASSNRDKAHQRLEIAYRAAHQRSPRTGPSEAKPWCGLSMTHSSAQMAIAFALGFLFALASNRKRASG